MFPFYYHLYRNSLPLDDTPYLKMLLEESIIIQASILSFFERNLNESNKETYKEIINNSQTHLNLLQIIYVNLFGKKYEYNNKILGYSNIEEVKKAIIDLSKKLRKLIYSLKSQTHKYMLFDIIIDNINNIILIN